MFYHSNYLIFRTNKLNKDFCLSDSTNSFHFKVLKSFCDYIVTQSDRQAGRREAIPLHLEIEVQHEETNLTMKTKGFKNV